MKKIILLIIAVCTLMTFTVSCGGKNNDIDMKKFIERMQKENSVSPEEKQEIRKSIFPNLKGNGK